MVAAMDMNLVLGANTLNIQKHAFDLRGENIDAANNHHIIGTTGYLAHPRGSATTGARILIDDGNILGPYILGDSTGLPAFWVMVAIFLGGGLFGFAGMVLGVPIFAVIYAFAQEFIENLLKKKGLSPDTADYYPVPAAENEHKLSIGIFEKLKKVNVKNDKK